MLAGLALQRRFAHRVDDRTRRPNLVMAVASPKDLDAAETVALLSDRPPIGEDATAYVCQRFVCRLPVTAASALADALDARP